MRSSGVFFMLLSVVVAVLLINTNVDCKATIEKIEEEAAGKQAKESAGGSESWAELANDKLSEGHGFKAADDQESDKSGCVKNSAKEKACELAEEAKHKAAGAYERTGEAKEKIKEKVCDMGKKVAEESTKREAEAEETLIWSKEKAKEGYEAAKSKAEETYESGKDTLSHHQEL